MTTSNANEGALAKYDDLTNFHVGITTEHTQIHDGKHFTCSDYDGEVDITSPKYWHIKTVDCWAHFVFKLRAGLNGTLEVFENPTITDNGTLLPTYNSYRDHPNTALTTVYKDSLQSADGVRLLAQVIGSDGTAPIGRSGGNVKREREIVLKENMSYLIKFTPVTDDTRVSMECQFYEC